MKATILVLALISLSVFTGASGGSSYQNMVAQAFESYKKSDYLKAIELMREAIEIAEKTVGPESAEVAHGLADLAALYRAEGGKLKQSSNQLKQKLGIQGSRLGIATEVFFDEVQERRQQMPLGEPSRGDDGVVNKSPNAQPSAPPDAGTSGPRR